MKDNLADFDSVTLYFSDATSIKGYIRMFSPMDFINGKVQYVFIVIPGNEDEKPYSRFIKSSYIDEIRFYPENPEATPDDEQRTTSFHPGFHP